MQTTHEKILNKFMEIEDIYASLDKQDHDIPRLTVAVAHDMALTELYHCFEDIKGWYLND